jgi:[ribosomal protein S5]-alanine N-acetyltransferase
MNFLPITSELCSQEFIQSSDFLKGLCATVINIYPQGVAELPWAGYFAEEAGVIIGTCAFKSRPVSGQVEIAYFTFPENEGKGIATRMAQYLIDLALKEGVTVTACTLPERNASAHILTKLGFNLVGLVNHPEDGEIWEWKLNPG